MIHSSFLLIMWLWKNSNQLILNRLKSNEVILIYHHYLSDCLQKIEIDRGRRLGEERRSCIFFNQNSIMGEIVKDKKEGMKGRGAISSLLFWSVRSVRRQSYFFIFIFYASTPSSAACTAGLSRLEGRLFSILSSSFRPLLLFLPLFWTVCLISFGCLKSYYS